MRIRIVKPPTTGELLDQYYADRGFDPGSGRAVGDPVASLPTHRELSQSARYAVRTGK